MKYFEQFETLNINDNNFRDLFFRVVSTSISEEQITIYTLSDYETIKDLSYGFYGSVDYWWVIAILNNVYDLNFDWVLTNEEINTIAKEKATDESGEVNTTDFLNYFDELVSQNDEKREVKLLQKTYINDFITDFIAQLQTEPSLDVYKLSGQEIISDMNQRMVDDSVFDDSVCDIETEKVLNLASTPNQLDIDLTWNLPSNMDYWHKIAIIQNNKVVDLIDEDETTHTIEETTNGNHIIDVVLLDKNEGVIVNTTVVPSISGRVWNNLSNVGEILTCCCRDDDNNFYVATNNGKIFKSDDFTTYEECVIATTDNIVDIKPTSGYIVAITEQETFVCVNGDDEFINIPTLSNPFFNGMQSLITIPETDYLLFGSNMGGRGYLAMSYIPASTFIRNGAMNYISSAGWVSSGLAIDVNNILLVQGGASAISIERLNNALSNLYSSVTFSQNANNDVAGQIVYNEYSEEYFAILTGFGTPQRNVILKSVDSYSWSVVDSVLDPFKSILMWCGGNGLLSGGLNTIQRSLDDGQSWEEVEVVDGNLLEFARMDNGTIVAITDGTNNIYVSNAE